MMISAVPTNISLVVSSQPPRQPSPPAQLAVLGKRLRKHILLKDDAHWPALDRPCVQTCYILRLLPAEKSARAFTAATRRIHPSTQGETEPLWM